MLHAVCRYGLLGPVHIRHIELQLKQFVGPPDHPQDTNNVNNGRMTKPDRLHGAIITPEQEDQCGFANRAIQAL